MQIPRLRRGYSLVEMVVVMGIIAILMLLSASAFVLVRDQAAADQTAEELLSTIREAQNKSISISRDRFGHYTKVWTVEVGSNNFSLLSYYPGTGAGLIGMAEKSNLNPQKTTITMYTGEGTLTRTTNPIYIFFNTPFGKSFVTKDKCVGSVTACIWSSSSLPTEEWVIPSPNTYVLTSTQVAKFVIDKNGHTATVVVKGNGDAYIE